MPSPFTDPGYRYATVRYPGDGVTVDFEFNFAGGYLSKDHVLCFEEDNLTHEQVQIPTSSYTIYSANQLQLEGVTVPVGKKLVILRDTPKDQPLQDFTDGAILNENNLNQTTQQAIFGVAEMVDRFFDMLDIFYSLIPDLVLALDQISDIINQLNQLQSDFDAFVISVTNQIEGLEDRVDALELSITDILNRLDALENAGYITDAPADGTTYGRKDGAWAPVEGGSGGIPDAPSDGTQYARQDGAWSQIDVEGEATTVVNTILAGYLNVRTLECSASGAFDAASDEIFRLPISEGFTGAWASHAAGVNPWRSSLQTAPTAEFDISARKNGTEFGYIRFAASAASGSWVNTGTSNVTFAVGDILTLVVVAADDTAAGFGLSVDGITVD